MSYLLSLASESGNLDDTVKYGKIIGLLEQAINKRQHHIEHIGGKYRVVSDFTKPHL